MTTIDAAASSLRQGGVIAYPTEGVWGLGCDPFNEPAVQRILTLKQRPVEKGLILVAASIEQTQVLTGPLPQPCKKRLDETWPGPNTWLIPDPDHVIPAWIRGQFDTVAIRVSRHPAVVALCEKFGGMLVSTSANPADLPPALTEQQVRDYFPDGIDLVLPGELGGQQGPSTIRDLMSELVIRQ